MILNLRKTEGIQFNVQRTAYRSMKSKRRSTLTYPRLDDGSKLSFRKNERRRISPSEKKQAVTSQKEVTEKCSQRRGKLAKQDKDSYPQGTLEEQRSIIMEQTQRYTIHSQRCRLSKTFKRGRIA